MNTEVSKKGFAKVLVIGSGGREHALAKKLLESPLVSEVLVAPGNQGMPASWGRLKFDSKSGREGLRLLAIEAKEAQVDLVIVGPDQALADGVADVFQDAGLLVFGPTAAAAQIESSKAFAKGIMESADISTAPYFVAQNRDEAETLLKGLSWEPPSLGWVIKADGLALGKGVQICRDLQSALEAVKSLIEISGSLVIEECLAGDEISWMAFCDGERCALLESARDYKRLLDGNKGPNTGGMGAMSPVPGLPPYFVERVEKEVFIPALREMKRRNLPFQGLLYAGLMFNPKTEKIWVLEFNARFGDPETQVLLPRMKGDFYLWCRASAEGNLKSLPKRVEFSSDSAVFVVAASEGYPEKSKPDQPIQFESSDSFYFAGVSSDDSILRTSGGRVLGALGMGPTLDLARKEAYHWIQSVHFEGMQFRTDIGKLDHQ